ncbi:hypothetical protein B0H16DRAFT_643027 [Mycena metata]|uniref:DUF6534 domain-containing protein n=1 Tax=Mycena metata TaxID=1033252 RepID=A0AAD7J8V7_9AGAR|nr:hypothetical protein B0H16DRAFT_643027 [Mycena metata]
MSNSTLSFDPSLTIGAYQIGVLVSYILFGIVTAQTYTYFVTFPEDSSKLKTLVAIVWSCEVAHILCIGHALFVDTISDYGHLERLTDAAPKSIDMTIFAGIVTTCSQSFFTLRIYKLSNQLFLSIILEAVIFLRLVAVAVVTVAGLRMTSVGSYEAQWGWLLATTWGVGAGCDLTITGVLVTLLLRRRADGRKRTAMLVEKIITWTIETGMLTSACWITMLACFLTRKYTLLWLAVFAVTPGVFSNSLLASLNSRARLRTMNEISLPYVNWTTSVFIPTNGNASRASKQIEAEPQRNDREYDLHHSGRTEDETGIVR